MQAKLWLTVVLILASGALVLVAGTSKLHEQVMTPFEVASAQTIPALSGLLIKHGADAVDAAARAAVDASVVAQLKSAEPPGPEIEAVLLGRAGQQGAPAFAALIKPDGTFAAKIGADVALPDSVAGLPEFVEARTGLARDGAERFGDKLFHLAVAPSFEAGVLTGVVMLGWAYDDAFADRLSAGVGQPVILVSGTQRYGSALKELTVAAINEREPGGIGAIDVQPLPGFLPVLLPERGRYLLSQVPMYIGDQGALQIFAALDRNQAFVSLAWAQGLVIAGTLLLALLQTLLIWRTLRSVTGPIEIIVDHLGQASAGHNVGILPEAKLSGPFLRLGKQINMLLQAGPSLARGAAPLGALGSAGMGPAVGPSNQPVPTPSLGGDTSMDRTATPPVSPPEPPPPNGEAPGQGGSGLSGLFDDNASAPDPLAAFRVPSTGPPHPAANPPPPPPPEPEPAPPGAVAANPEATVMFQVPHELLAQSAQPAPASAGFPPGFQTDDARTVVAAVPQELLSQSAPRPDGLNSADEIHYREVYDKFVETRVQCAEDTSDLTYDRFLAKLLKNRQQIVEKHKAKGVRFQVYVKEGKAALRALPVRE